MKKYILRDVSFSFVLLFLSGCYTIVSHPIDDSQIDSSNNEIIPDNYSSDEYIIINNYHCNNHNRRCHSHSNYYGCCDYHQSYSWWTDDYSCSSYYWNGYNNYAHGYYHGYSWGYNNGWWNNSWWWNTGDGSNNDYADNNQERRDRSFERSNEGADDTENNYTLFGMTFSGNSEKSVAPINHKNNYRKSLPPQIDSKSKSYKKKENKGSGLLGLLFGSKKSDSHKKSGSSGSSPSYKSDKSNKSENPKKSDSKKSNSKTNRKQTKGRR